VELETVTPREAVDIRCDAPDVELLLADWLNALVFEGATRRMIFGRFQVRITDGHLEGTAWGETIDRARHRPGVEVKGATYTELAVRREVEGYWVAQCVVDV
jgi:tRNA nucleotidyltransferase (CCA-adding enzyme)